MFVSSLLCLAMGAGGFGSQEGWYHVRVDVPNAAVLQRLQDSDLDVMDCIPHLGSVDVAVGPGDLNELAADGYTYTYVSKLEDPKNWGARHQHGNARVSDDYRFHYFSADQILAFY